MFNSYEFSFDGESSSMYGLMKYDIDGRGQGDVSFGNTASIMEVRTNRRVQPIHLGVSYNKPLQFKLVFGSEQPLDRFDLEAISLWLTGHQDYKWLSVYQPDMEHLQFKCIVRQLTPISVGWLPYAFEADIICDCPYAYGLPREEEYIINGESDIIIRNDSSAREYIWPGIHFIANNELTDLSIVNASDGNREFLLEDIPSSAEVSIDNTNGIIRDLTGENNLYDGFNMNFFRLVQGDNVIHVSGHGVLTLSWRTLHNVAG